MKSVRSAVAESRVRYIFGVFWRGKEENEKLFKYLNEREGGLLFQPFWTGDADDRFGDEDMAAVAERFCSCGTECEVHCRVPRVRNGAWPLSASLRARHEEPALVAWSALPLQERH